MRFFMVAVMLGLGVASSGLSGAWAQDMTENEDMAKAVAAPEDVASIEAIIEAVYDVISGPAGPRDWDRMRTLFVPDARFATRDTREPTGVLFRSLEAYIEGAGEYFMQEGFFETGIHNKAERFDSIAHVFSTYESRRAPDAEPFSRGINSFQLLRHDGRWWITGIYWQSETDDAPIPAQYLP